MTWAGGYGLQLARPWIVVVAAVFVVSWLLVLRRTRLSLPRERRAPAIVLGMLALVAAALAAADLEVIVPADRMTVVFAEDHSRSMDLVPNADVQVLENLRRAELSMRPHDRLGLVRFGASPALVAAPYEKGAAHSPADPAVGRDATDLEAGLRRAVDEVLAGGGGRVVLFSDGVENQGQALIAAARARNVDVPIDTVFLASEARADLQMISLRGPSLADEGETIELAGVVHVPAVDRPGGADGTGSTTVDVEVTVRRDGAPISTYRTKVRPGEDVLRFRERAPEPGLHRYDFHVRPLDATLDGSTEDNEAATFVRVRGPSTVLILQTTPEQAHPLRRALEGEGFRVAVRDAAHAPVDLAEMVAFDLIVLADLPAKDLLPAQMEGLARYVRDFGGGLLLLGSETSMGPGGYGRTAIEDISPVAFDLTQEKRRSALTELIVIDVSGSMGAMVDGQHMKIDLANEAAARAASLLGNADRLGVWHVDVNVAETVPLGPVGDRTGIGRKIRSVGPGGGGIFIDLSLREGYRALSKERIALRHLLLFSDGADAEERTEAPYLVKKAAASGITTSVIALGDGQDVAALEEMAKLGGGRFYLITDARKLPSVFAQETILAARSSVREEEFVPHVRSGSAAIRGLTFASHAPLRGYVVTQMKPRAELVLDGPEGDPILALWPVGLGHVAAWTSDWADRWAAAFTHWPGSAQLATQLAREIARKSDEARVRLSATAQDGTLHVTGEPTGLSGKAGLMVLRAHVDGPDGQGQDVELVPTVSGPYEADVHVSAPGAYVVRALATDETGTVPVGLAAAVLSRADELRPNGGDARTMERIALVSGGLAQVDPTIVFTRRTGLRPTPFSLSPWLLGAALLALLLGVAARKLGVPRFRVPAVPLPAMASVRLIRLPLPSPGVSGAPARPAPPKAIAPTEPTPSPSPSSNATATLAVAALQRTAKHATRPTAAPSARGPIIIAPRGRDTTGPRGRDTTRPTDPSVPPTSPAATPSLTELARRKREQKR